VSDLDFVSKVRQAFYRLVGSLSADPALTIQGESTDDVAYLMLTRGSREAQRWMLDQGYEGWRKRSSALTFSGADDTDGGKYVSLPSDFLRAYTSERRSALVEANGDQWGRELDAEDDRRKGDWYYLRGDKLWLARLAAPPTTLYLEYHYQHPAWTSGVTIDFPLEARWLVVAEAAGLATSESWFPGDRESEARIHNRLLSERQHARRIARQGKGPRRLRMAKRYGTRY